MRRVSLLLCLALIAGCGRSFESQIEGTWHVDAASVSTPRLTSGAEKRQDWIDATRGLANVQVAFSKDRTVKSQGFGATSEGRWSLRGTLISVDSKEAWPTMIFDPKGPRIHLVLERGADSLKMDLVR